VRIPRSLVLAVAVAVLAGACSADAGSGTTAEPTVPTAPLDAPSIDGPLRSAFDLEGAELWVGSEDDPTQILLGYIAVEALASVGAEVEDRMALGGSLVARESLLSGEIDLYWERLGTAWTGYLREPEVPDDGEELYRLLAARDAEENGVVWLAPAAFSDGQGFAMAEDFAEALEIESISDMGRYIDEGRPTTICVTSDFTTFPTEGRVDFEQKLDTTIPDDTLRVWDPEPIYPSTGDGTCLFGQVERVNGRVLQYELRVLADDVGLFGYDNPAMTVREDVYDEHPELAPLFAVLADALDEPTMQRLNERVEVDGEDPRAVARSWLEEEGLV
jgi:osmoprotectant transport system substrate-binding protein